MWHRDPDRTAASFTADGTIGTDSISYNLECCKKGSVTAVEVAVLSPEFVIVLGLPYSQLQEKVFCPSAFSSYQALFHRIKSGLCKTSCMSAGECVRKVKIPLGHFHPKAGIADHHNWAAGKRTGHLPLLLLSKRTLCLLWR